MKFNSCKVTAKIFNISILALLLSSCSKLISDEFPDFDPVPNINCILVAGEQVMLQVSMAEKIDSMFLTLVDDADVQLSDGNGTELDIYSLGEGLYASDSMVIPGQVYSTSIRMDGYPEIQARDTVPLTVAVQITDQHNHFSFDEYGEYLERIEFSFIDDPGSKDYYEVIVYKRERSYTGRRYAFNINSIVLLNEGLEPYSTGTLVFSDAFFEDKLVHMQLDFHHGYHRSCWGDNDCYQIFDPHTVIIELRHVSREYYLYKKNFYLYEKNRYPFFIDGTATAFPAYTNIENGIGVMAALSTSIDSIQVEGDTIALK